MNKVRFAIVGCGAIAPWHARAINNLENAELVACCDIIENKAKVLAASYEIPKTYKSHKKMLKSKDIDAVCVCTPSGTHGTIVRDAARAGKHVMVEKPVEVTLRKIDSMIETCKREKVKLGCIFQRRSSALWDEIKTTVENGCLGKMVLGDAYLKYYRSQEYYDNGGWRGTWKFDGGSALMNQGIHMVDILTWIMGPVVEVYAHADHLLRDIETEDTAVAVLKFASGAFGVLEGATTVKPGMEHRIELHGSEGTIVVEGEKIKTWDFVGCQAPPELSGMGGVDIKAGTSKTEVTDQAVDGHQLLIADFCDAIIHNRTPKVSGEEARKAVELITAVYKSAKTGRPVKLAAGRR